MKKGLFIVFIAILFLLSLASCESEDEICQGVVVRKEFKPAYSAIMTMPQTVFTGETFTIISVPYFFSYPDRWSITISKTNGEKEDENTFWVSEEVYNSIAVGDWFDGKNASMKEPHTKEKKQ